MEKSEAKQSAEPKKWSPRVNQQQNADGDRIGIPELPVRWPDTDCGQSKLRGSGTGHEQDQAQGATVPENEEPREVTYVHHRPRPAAGVVSEWSAPIHVRGHEADD